ncbi:hypothetical protein Cgig2_024393 [Carnegiea gigantea]|uniref:Uncharacterized protein n=1 Tax=Carnegiea gigantea TaxID=171969 RepID=A0A9Q1JIM2_9CARY|nr:hypothetical protein Cgig2_024393 [Carnegiea gigantea]
MCCQTVLAVVARLPCNRSYSELLLFAIDYSLVSNLCSSDAAAHRRLLTAIPLLTAEPSTPFPECKLTVRCVEGDDVVYMLGRVIRGRSRGKVMLSGGRKDYVWVKENICVLEVLRIVGEAMGEGVRGWQMWYSLKCNRLELLPLGRDSDVKKLMKGNDEYAYLYVAGSEGPCVGRVQRNEACEE